MESNDRNLIYRHYKRFKNTQKYREFIIRNT